MKRDTYRITYHDGEVVQTTSDTRAFRGAHAGASVEIRTAQGWKRADVYMDDAEQARKIMAQQQLRALVEEL